jgi:MHS family proline/betaine transporter-like MFS transporter
MVEEFPRRLRCSALSVGYNISLEIFGGTIPLFASYVFERSHDDYSPAFYQIGQPLDTELDELELPAEIEPAI